MGTFQKFCLRWNNHTPNLLGTLGHILASEQHSDVILCCQGEVWRLHKLVLCASSSHFEKLLAALPPGNSPIVVLDGPHPQDVASLIHFIYHGEVNVDQENLASLLRTAESLKIKGLAEVSSVTSGGEHKSHIEDDCQRQHHRGRSRVATCHSTPIYSLGGEYSAGMYGFVPQPLSPLNHVPDPLERDPSPLNLSFNGNIKNIHDETPQERQERRNRLDDLLYAATERSKKEERREARREAREAALREAATVREASVILSNDQVAIPPAKRARTGDMPRPSTLPAHPAFHIPLVNLTIPSSASTSVIATQNLSTQTSCPPQDELPPEDPALDVQSTEMQQEQLEIQDNEGISETSPTKSEKLEEAYSDPNTLEEAALNSDESDTQSAPETPSEAATAPPPPPAVPSTTTAATQVCTAYGVDGVSQTPSSLSTAVPNTTLSATNSAANTPPSEPVEEKVTPYYHSILQQVAEGNTSGETASSNAQRVTINMRTFKEEWRRQLLVDYDTRTNMSICMLCFTTFKSYDGPRKNTYVKHAKRFHPSLEEYSEQERDLIINMYEKYHKYDVDMQKEVNKSYRAANAIVALGKKGSKHCDTNPEATSASDLSLKVTAEGDAPEETKETSEASGQKEEESLCVSGKSRSLTPESDVSLEASERNPEKFESEDTRENVKNNNVSTAPLPKRSAVSMRGKTSASATTVTV
ncbi:Protein tramtrack, alpha isoform [Chionoecetes opilio]|uniref:Protein tramtrack, alpha isoform n=1 Tax=Chionoecetes opilio TaxID=41210 RepID=A0A8J4YK32_CHIOP|nr:Protein tramtrack, alpha isoform [Chionoecetes opilio]